MQKNILKCENGSITLFILLAILFFLIVIFSLFMNSSNKNVIQSSEIDKIKEEYQESVDNIDQIYDDTLNEHITDYLQVGDYVNYTYDTITNGYSLKASESGHTSNQTITQTKGLKWRILDIHDNGSIDLISDVHTNEKVYFEGALGYNNGVLLINDICKQLYSNSELGIIARSLDIKDIEDQMNETGKEAKNAYTNVIQYGKTKTYGNGSNQYPALYAKENGSGINTTTVKKDGIDVNADGYEVPTTAISNVANNGLTVTQTYYEFNNTLNSYFNDSRVYNMLFGTNPYWLASRYANCYSTYVGFGLRDVNGFILGGIMVYTSTNYTNNYDRALRPVVSIKTSQIQLCTGDSADGADTTISHMHQIIPTK